MNQPEHDLQVALIQWWELQCGKYKLPSVALFAIPNGAKRNIVTAVKLKAEGVKKGVADLFLCAPSNEYHGFFIELKAGKNGLSKEQKDFAEYAKSQGYKCETFWDWQLAAEQIDAYLKLNTKS